MVGGNLPPLFKSPVPSYFGFTTHYPRFTTHCHKADFMTKGKIKPTIGWRESVVLPDLSVKAIKAKIDTGARTSALHAYELELYRERGAQMARFGYVSDGF